MRSEREPSISNIADSPEGPATAWRALVTEYAAMTSEVVSSLGKRPTVKITIRKALQVMRGPILGATASHFIDAGDPANMLLVDNVDGELRARAAKAGHVLRDPTSPEWCFRTQAIQELPDDEVDVLFGGADVSGWVTFIPVEHVRFPAAFLVWTSSPLSADGRLTLEFLTAQTSLCLSNAMARSGASAVRREFDSARDLDGLEESARRMSRSFLDLEHQLKGPIRQAWMRVNHTLRLEASREPALQRELLALRGILRKASRVTASTGLFADLSSDHPIRINQQRLSLQDLRKMCVEAATDYQLLSERDRGLRFTVDSESFGLAGTGVFLDKELINQALNNILDNASKYSYRGTRVLIRLGMSKTGSYLGITNQGIPIRPTEVTKVFERGWRSEDAMLVVGEGTGIGLWIVDNIMKAHGGSVRVISNTARGVTEFRLYLPSTPLHV